MEFKVLVLSLCFLETWWKQKIIYRLGIMHSFKIRGLLVFDGSGFAMAIEFRWYLWTAIIGLCGVTDGEGKAAN